MAEAVGALRIDLFANLANFRDGINKATAQLKAFSRTADNIASGFERIGGRLSLGLTAPLGLFGAKAIQAATDAAELQSAFNFSFGKMADEANVWAEETGNAFGRSTQTMQKAAFEFNQLFKAAAPTEEAAFALSSAFAELSSDVGSFLNLSDDEAIRRLRAGLAGEAEPLRRLGVFINEATVRNKAFQLGIAKTGSELTEQQKILARSVLIMEGLKDAQGDVGRTFDSSANQIKKTREEFNEVLIEVGNDLLPVFVDFLKVLQGVLKSFASLDDGTRKTIVTFAAVAAVIGPAALAIGGLIRVVAFAARGYVAFAAVLKGLPLLFRAKTLATVQDTAANNANAISSNKAATAALGLKGKIVGNTLGFLALAAAAYEAGRAIVGIFHDSGPPFEVVKAQAEGVRDALIEQGYAAGVAREAVKQLLLTAGGDLSKITEENARKIIEQSVAFKLVGSAAKTTKPPIDDLVKSFGDLGEPVGYTADQLERVRGVVFPVNAALKTYNENLKTAAAAGVSAADAQKAFGLELIQSLGGVDKARAVIEKLPPVVQKLVREITAADEFEGVLARIAEGEEKAAEKIKAIEEEAAENVKRIREGLQSFADSLTEQFDPAAAFENQMAKIDAAFRAGKISADVYKAAKDAAFAETPEGEALEEALKERAKTIYDISSALTDAAVGARSFGDAIKQLVIDALKANVIKPFFQNILGSIIPQPTAGGGGFDFGSALKGIGSFLGFGGTRDRGGVALPGMAYKIGSGVSETFIPDEPGRISRGPGNAAGAAGVTVVQNFNGPDPGSFRRSERQMARSARREFAIG